MHLNSALEDKRTSNVLRYLTLSDPSEGFRVQIVIRAHVRDELFEVDLNLTD